MKQDRKKQGPIRISTLGMAGWIGLLLLGGLAGGLSAQTPVKGTGPLRLGQMYRAVEAANPRIAAAGALARAADARIPPARRPPDPQLQFGLMNRSLPGFGLADPLGMNQVQLMQMVPFPGKLRMAGQVASARAEAERARAFDVPGTPGPGRQWRSTSSPDGPLAPGGRGTLRILQDLAVTAARCTASGGPAAGRAPRAGGNRPNE
jgi:hypothetical protein